MRVDISKEAPRLVSLSPLNMKPIFSSQTTFGAGFSVLKYIKVVEWSMCQTSHL